MKDTVTTDKQHHKVKAHKNSWQLDPVIGLDAVIHDHVPVLTGQDLRRKGGTTSGHYDNVR